MPRAQRTGRAKISTTVAAETYQYLTQKVARGEASTLAEAIDRSIHRVRQLERRSRLAQATAEYFDNLEPQAASEENAIARDLASAAESVDFDKEL